MNSHHPDVVGNASAAGALVSLVGFILSFFSTTHVWLQNLVLIISLIAGIFAICAWVYKAIVWIQSFFSK
jgi:uncharacterized membrane protein YccC